MARLWRFRSERQTREEAARERAETARAYHAVFAGPQGQMVLADILTRAGLVGTSFVAGDPCATAFNEGKRRLGLEIIERLNVDPDNVVRMLREGETAGLMEEQEA
jgi:hypothetical protein